MKHSDIKEISVIELKKLLDKDKNLTLIDVREDDEWELGHIPGAIHMPKDEISDKICSIILDKNHPVYLHCRSGVRSLYAANCLISLGYTNVYSVDGGILDWMNNNYHVI